MTHKIKETTAKAKQPQNSVPATGLHNTLTAEEKDVLKRHLPMFPSEFESLSSKIHFVSYHYLGWFMDGQELEPVLAQVYVYRDNRWEGDSIYLNHQAFYVRCEFDCRVWRVKKISLVPKIIKALKKDVRLRNPNLNFTDWKSKAK